MLLPLLPRPTNWVVNETLAAVRVVGAVVVVVFAAAGEETTEKRCSEPLDCVELLLCSGRQLQPLGRRLGQETSCLE